MKRAIILGAAIVASTADARPFEDIGGAAQLHYELSTLSDIDHEPGMAPAPKDFVMAGARLHGFVGGKRWGYHVGLDLAAGQTVRPHSYLAWDVAFFPVGLALRFGETSFATLGGGIGSMGAVGTLDDAMTMPLELRFEVGRATRILGRVRASYLFRSPARMDGGVTSTFGDELEASVGLRLGRAYTDWDFPTGDGYFIAANYREALGARYFGVTLGFSIDMGTKRSRFARMTTTTATDTVLTATSRPVFGHFRLRFLDEKIVRPSCYAGVILRRRPWLSWETTAMTAEETGGI